MQTRIRRYYLLDVLRGLASLAVVIWHYQHFYYLKPGDATGFVRSQQPFYAALQPFYEYGAQAVHLFFILSGFIFFTLYRDAVRLGQISGWKFAVLRFSRLYPLHFVTLVWVAAVQFLALARTGSFLVYTHNDLRHFVLNVFLATSWGLEKGHSYNEPIWSVSLEIIFYGVFFCFAKMTKSRWLPVALVLGICVLLQKFAPIFATGLLAFFTGGLITLAHESLWLAGLSRSRRLCLAATLAVLPVLTYSSFATLDLEGFVRKHNELILFPTLVCILILAQTLWEDAGRRWQWIGDITYSAYLLHVPIQLTILLSAKTVGKMPDFNRGETFLLYMLLVLASSVVCFRSFEMPAQNLIRRRMLAWGIKESSGKLTSERS